MIHAYNEDANAYNKPTLFGELGRWNSSLAAADGSLPVPARAEPCYRTAAKRAQSNWGVRANGHGYRQNRAGAPLRFRQDRPPGSSPRPQAIWRRFSFDRRYSG